MGDVTYLGLDMIDFYYLWLQSSASARINFTEYWKLLQATVLVTRWLSQAAQDLFRPPTPLTLTQLAYCKI